MSETLERLKDGRLDILIATDVAARGTDVERISPVVNYDIPMDSESYVHRIGRTGRAGRAGRALLFVENRERRLLRNIERTMKLTIPEVELPNAELLGKRRLEKFAAKVQQQLESSDLDQYRALLAKNPADRGRRRAGRGNAGRCAAENGPGRTFSDRSAGCADASAS